MTDGTAPNALYLALLLVLVASSLVAMRLPMGKALKMAAGWVAIFAVGFIIFSFRGEFSSLGARLRAEAVGSPIQSGEELHIPKAADGHFWVDARINGHQAPFLVDSGASVTTLDRKTAAAAEVEPDMRVAVVETANGIVRMRVASVDEFMVGSIARQDFTVHINSVHETNVLGMNFLSSLDSWRVEGNYLVLRP